MGHVPFGNVPHMLASGVVLYFQSFLIREINHLPGRDTAA